MVESDDTEMKRSDTTATDSSGQSMQDVQPSSPTSPTASTNPITSEQASIHSRPGTSGGRKRKVPDSVTPNACTSCKKARAKVSRCFPVVGSQRTKLLIIVRRREASLSTMRATSYPRLLSLRDTCQDRKGADDSRNTTVAAEE